MALLLDPSCREAISSSSSSSSEANAIKTKTMKTVLGGKSGSSLKSSLADLALSN